MALEQEHLAYPHRQYGMDHDWYRWSMLTTRPKVVWPEQAKLAVWVNVALQFFPLNQRGQPFKVVGGMQMPYPDLRHFTLRDYGNRVGVFRILDALDRFDVIPTFAISAALATRLSYLVDVVKERGNEVLCHGFDMDTLHFGGLPKDKEREQIRTSLGILRESFRAEINGWLSPGRSESENTPELLVEQGLQYCCDWVNDDMPYPFKTAAGELFSMPLSNELEDVFILMSNQHSETSYVEQICDAATFLSKEADEQGGRMLGLNIHPWMLGQPHRIKKLEAVLEFLTSLPGVWFASAHDILASFKNQQG
ncbi:MAG: polysaccharide deacetylase family protein [Gammaproteobacteria bacterium]|nr:polysaccharide deacetylase family protein [Gammaproteobacteria bacterium]